MFTFALLLPALLLGLGLLSPYLALLTGKKTWLPGRSAPRSW